MSVLLGAGSDHMVYRIHSVDCSMPRYPCFRAPSGSRSPERDPLKLHSLVEKQLTGTCACSSVLIAPQAVTDGLSETEEDALFT